MFTLLLTGLLFAQTPAAVSTIILSPSVIGEIDLNTLKGVPRRLSWSPDGAQLYLQTIEFNRDGSIKATHHFLIPAAGGVPKATDDEPEWSKDYWDWKSNRWAPGDEAFAIEFEQTKKTASATSAPMAGDMAKGSIVSGTSGTSMENAVSAAQLRQEIAVYTLRLKGEAVGVWENERPVPGLTFGWGPQGSNLIAFADQNGGALVIMDRSGAKKKIDGTKDVLLPAWAADGSRIAYLQIRGKNKYAVVVGSVSR
jgi:dipeptidyl aminopeptidase/acylaminoacyl peptidase